VINPVINSVPHPFAMSWNRDRPGGKFGPPVFRTVPLSAGDMPPNVSPAPFPSWRATLDPKSLLLRCCVCDTCQLKAPLDATPRTRFWWFRDCCLHIWIGRHVAEARDTRLAPHRSLRWRMNVHAFMGAEAASHGHETTAKMPQFDTLSRFGTDSAGRDAASYSPLL
jgi:hypothetical protein